MNTSALLDALREKGVESKKLRTGAYSTTYIAWRGSWEGVHTVSHPQIAALDTRDISGATLS